MIGTIGAMRRSQMHLQAKRHFLFTDWTIHKLGLRDSVKLAETARRFRK
jgi:hypothetical protein